MIETIPTSRDDLLEIRLSGAVTEDDYRSVLVPAIDAAIARADHVRLLMRIDSKVSDFTLGAMWQDTRLGLSHWRGFDRVAVVTGSGGLRGTIGAFSVFLPCPVMVFDPGQEDEARRWLTESLGAIHQTDLGGGVLHLQLLGKVDGDAYERAARDLDAFIRRNDRFRLLLDIREFDGWQGLGAVGQHLRLVRDHVALLDKAAIVGDATWQKMAIEIGRRVIGKEARYFPASEIDAARTWIAAD